MVCSQSCLHVRFPSGATKPTGWSSIGSGCGVRTRPEGHVSHQCGRRKGGVQSQPPWALGPPHPCLTFSLRALGALLVKHSSHGDGVGGAEWEARTGIPCPSLGFSQPHPAHYRRRHQSRHPLHRLEAHRSNNQPDFLGSTAMFLLWGWVSPCPGFYKTKGASPSLCKCSQPGPGLGLPHVLSWAVDRGPWLSGCVSET